MNNKQLLIFDLDGTLLNTIKDIASAANHALRENNYPEHDTKTIKSFVGNGTKKLLERTLPEGEKTEENIAKLFASFVPYYNENGAKLTCAFDGMEELLRKAQDKGLHIAVASNKYHLATNKLVHTYFKGIDFSVILGQRDGVPTKPDPTIVNEICSITNIAKENILYIGDSEVDMETAKNANVDVIGVTWGCKKRSDLEKYNPNHIVDTAQEIINLIV